LIAGGSGAGAWPLGLGIAATLSVNVTHGLGRGGIGAPAAAWSAIALDGSYELLKMTNGQVVTTFSIVDMYIGALTYYRRRELGEGCMDARRLHGVMDVTRRFSPGPDWSVGCRVS
jgi:hypothetical protein